MSLMARAAGVDDFGRVGERCLARMEALGLILWSVLWILCNAIVLYPARRCLME